MEESVWMNTIGRVAFLNCDPLFYGLDKQWEVLAAPPAWRFFYSRGKYLLPGYPPPGRE